MKGRLVAQQITAALWDGADSPATAFKTTAVRPPGFQCSHSTLRHRGSGAHLAEGNHPHQLLTCPLGVDAPEKIAIDGTQLLQRNRESEHSKCLGAAVP